MITAPTDRSGILIQSARLTTILVGLAMWPSTAVAGAAAPTYPKTFWATMLAAYPDNAGRKGLSGGALVDLWGNKAGIIHRCDFITSIGDASLARTICSTVLRKKLTPAVDAAGMKAMGRQRVLLKWTTPGNAQAREVSQTVQQPELELTVARLPAGVKQVDAGLVLTVLANGSVKGCQPGADVSKDYAALACQQISAVRFPGSPAGEGASEPYITAATVRFVAD